MKRTLCRTTSLHRGRDVTTLRSGDGVIEFHLVPTDHGVFVERVRTVLDTRVVQAVHFADDAKFSRWCDADSVRFEYPMVHVKLKTNGAALFERLKLRGHAA
jgi:hypothetical protein